ncbi:MAG TPA: hypothetical protein VK772_01185 [Puia sp.]|jgi:hypothetical protein|nr:hypothetical protein [Puia sp.]
MEAAAIFSSEKGLVNLFYKFTNSYDKLCLSSKDNDTAYFENKESGKNEIFLHYVLDDVEYEFSYNFSEEDVEEIRKYFKGYPIYLFYISYRGNLFLEEFFQSFVYFLEQQEDFRLVKVLLHHPFDGLIPI